MFGAGVAPFCFCGLSNGDAGVTQLDKRLEDIITEEIDLLGYELVKLESSLTGRKRVIRLFIDRPGREIGVDDCVRISKAVGFVLDGEDLIREAYNLEVSSPGMNRPLVKREHFERFAGKTAKVVSVEAGGESRTHIGRIVGMEGEELLLATGSGEVRIPFDSIAKANLHGEKWEVPNVKKRKRNEG
jgi:ribosome maturation factor RimP